MEVNATKCIPASGKFIALKGQLRVNYFTQDCENFIYIVSVYLFIRESFV